MRPPPHQPSPFGSTSATPPQGGQPQGLYRFAGWQGGGYWLAPPPHQPSPAARLLRLPLKGGNRRACIDLLGGKVAGIGWPPHRISLRLTARLLRLPLKGGVIPAVLTGDIVYTLDWVHGLHLARGIGQGAWFAAQESLPPMRGSRQDKGGARSRAGGGQTPRPVSECQRHGQRSAGGEIAASSQHAMPLQNAANYLSRPRFRQAISATGGEVLRICGERSTNLYFLVRLSALVEVDQRPDVFSFLRWNVVFSAKLFVSSSMAGELHLNAMTVVIERYRT